MTRARIDPTLTLPEPGGPAPVLSGAEGILALPGPARSTPFLVEAADVRVTGAERDGVGEIRMGTTPVVSRLVTAAGPAANVLATPATLRRECIGRLGMVQETLLVPVIGGIAAIQWRLGRGGEAAFLLHFTVGAGSEGVAYRAGEHAVTSTLPSGGSYTVLLDPVPASWTVVENPSGGIDVSVEATISSERPLTLLVADMARGPARAATVMRHLAVHEAGANEPPWSEQGGLRLETGVAELDEGLGWLSARVGSVGAATDDHPDSLLWWGLGALASGHCAAAERVHDTLASAAGAQVHQALLAARIAMVTGRTERAAAAARSPGLQAATARDASGLAAQARSALADALRYAAPEEELRALRDAAPPQGRPTTGVRLPMAAAAVRYDGIPPWLAAIIRGQPLRVVSEEEKEGDAAALIASLAAAGAGAYPAWRALVAAGLDGGPGGRGTWDATDACPARAGALVCGLAHGILGWDPDAPVGRVTLAPTLPAHFNAFSVDGLQVGDARLRLEYIRDGEATHEWRLTPTAGRVPPTVVFRPSVPGGTVESVWMDDAPADLASERRGDRVTLSAQLPLDATRTVRVTTAGGA